MDTRSLFMFGLAIYGMYLLILATANLGFGKRWIDLFTMLNGLFTGIIYGKEEGLKRKAFLSSEKRIRIGSYIYVMTGLLSLAIAWMFFSSG